MQQLYIISYLNTPTKLKAHSIEMQSATAEVDILIVTSVDW